MSQNVISLELTDAQLTAAADALATLEAAFGGLIALDPDEARSLVKMGPKSEAFVRQALNILGQNPQIVPPSLELPNAQADQIALDRLRPLLIRLSRLAERGNDTETALGSDMMDVALQGYALLKVAGRQQGLDALRQELGSRFARSRRAATPSAT